MKDVVKIVEERIFAIRKELSMGYSHKELIDELKQLKDFLYVCELLKKHNIKASNVLDVFSLPQIEGACYGEYRIMNDYETEDRSFWKEIEMNNEIVRIYPGDIIIKKK